MNVFNGLAIFCLANAILSFIDIETVPKKFKNLPWKKEYNIKNGIVFLLFSVIYYILYKVVPPMEFDFWTKLVLVLALFAPMHAVRYFFIERKYEKRLAEQNDKDNT